MRHGTSHGSGLLVAAVVLIPVLAALSLVWVLSRVLGAVARCLWRISGGTEGPSQ